jgi:hypothetical protein
MSARGRFRFLPQAWRDEFNHLRPPVDNRLQGSSSWLNLATKRDRERPPGWVASER